jgi:hypothetical protein
MHISADLIVHFRISITRTAKKQRKTARDPAVFPIAEPLAAQDFRGKRDNVG